MNGQAELFIQKGNDAIAKRDFAAAAKEYTAAIEADPNFAEAYMRRAIAYTEQSMKDLAIADLKKAADLNYKEAASALKAYFGIDY